MSTFASYRYTGFGFLPAASIPFFGLQRHDRLDERLDQGFAFASGL